MIFILVGLGNGIRLIIRRTVVRPGVTPVYRKRFRKAMGLRGNPAQRPQNGGLTEYRQRFPIGNGR